jgi:hypothetical protein
MIDEANFDVFLKGLEDHYLDNPYHNSTHAADVMGSMIYFVE